MASLLYRTLRQEVADAIRQKILDGELKPGARIVEQDMAVDLGVSRGPVREALREIEQDGLIEYTRNVGCSVKRITDEDMYEIYLLRANYEILAVKLCKAHITDATLQTMKETLERMQQMGAQDFDASILYDNQFHGCVIRQIGLPRLLQRWSSLNPGNVATYYVGSTDRLAAVKRQYPIHKAVYDAYCTQDEPTICKALMDHYMLTVRRRLGESSASLETFPYPTDF